MTRTCPCGKPFTRRGDEPADNWAKRRYCGRSCAGTARRQTQIVNAGRRLAVVIEEADWLRGTDSPAHVAARLGYSNLESLRRVLRTVGRRDLAAWFHEAKVPS